MSKILDTLRGYLGASTDDGLQARVAPLIVQLAGRRL